MRRDSLAVLSLVTILAVRALAEDPKLPDETKPFARTQRARLASVWGGYAFKHAHDVSVLAFSADGRSVIAGDDRALVFWERASGREERLLATGGTAVLSPDRKKLLVAGDGLALLEVSSGKKLASADGRVAAARFAHDGKRVIALAGATATVHDAEKLKEGRTLHLDGAATFAVLSPDGKHALVGDPRKLVLHDLERQKKGGALESDSPLVAVVWDGDLLVTGAQDGKVRAWDSTKLDKPLWERAHKGAIVALSVAAKKVAALSEDGALVVRDLAGADRHAFEDPGARAVALSDDGLVVASARNMVKLWSLESGKRIGAPDAGHEGPVLALAVSSDHLHVLSASMDHTARVWNVSSARALHVLDQKAGAVTAVAFSPDAREALTASDDGTLELWDMKEGADLHRMKDVGPVGAVGFGAGVIRAIGSEGRITFFERTKLQKSLEAGAKAARAPVALAGKLALLGNEKGLVKVWDVETAREVRTLDGRLPLRAVAVSASGKRGLTGGAEFLKVFDVSSGFELRGLDVKSFTISALAIAADDQFALAATEEGKVGLWNLETGKCVDVIDLAPTRDVARSVAFTQDGFLLGTARGVVLRFEWIGT